MKIDDNFAKNEVIFNSKFQGLDSEKNEEVKNPNSFSEVLKNMVNDVNNNAIQANKTTNSFIKGEDVSIDEVMVKNQEASLSLQFLTQTRDKLLEGYNELSKMQL